ncbi:MAG: hypothetical protein PHW18_07390 [Sulfuricurvum sp.]|uniref:hypothetical protein n=1 Tax=Sulfuricurvum sp. TaxID=2025608 RepID=UPI002623DCE6|nr:hypothetical protein [Sulfuricurvum sp.]MDD2829379.1 hypothetical protein [Sulfuricurvum sp.]MDD4949130.1 hypothetical protein [Sulfuricurvum sp.]
MKASLFLSLTLLILSGCSATWSGIKEDTHSLSDWTKKQVNESATYVQEKTK